MKTLDELGALIESQGAENKKRTDEVVASVKTLTDEVQVHAKQLRELTEGRDRDQQRMTTIEASASMLGGQLRGVSEAVSRIENETKSQTSTLKVLEADKIARDAVAKADEKRKGHLFQMAGIALALLTAIGGGIGWLITQHQAEKQPPSALVAPRN